MLSITGNVLILTILVITCLIIYKSLASLKNKKDVSILPFIYQLNLLQITLTITTFFVLVAAFIVSDFSLITVFQNSHTSKPLIYKITGTWGNHEGSLLLWTNIMVIFSFLFFVINRKNKNYQLYTLIIQNILIIGFFLFLFLNSNPFNKIFPIPKNGLGLNPILQDPALAIHPPLLYIGFVGSSIFFSAAVAALMTDINSNYFARSIKPWIFVSWIFQTLGIVVGSIWAYYELGWGGFWFWDPVENASLLPWFAMTALIHSILVLEKKGNLINWVIILCLLTFILSVTGTFLVRSGVLNSVHTFANDPSRGIYILSYLSLMILFSIIIFFKKSKKEKYFFYINSKETFILGNNWFMLFYLITVFVGIVYPIFTEVVADTKISVGPPFYNSVIIPVVVPFLLAMAVGPNLKWNKNEFFNIKKFLTLFLLAIFVNIFLVMLFKSSSFIINLILITSLFLIFYSLTDFYNSIYKKIKFDLGRIISHLGFGLMIFFIALNSNFSYEKNFNAKVGEIKEFNIYKIKFNGLGVKEKKNYQSIAGSFSIINIEKNTLLNLDPEIRIYKNPETITYEASIKSFAFQDYYLTMSNISGSDVYNIKFQNKPFMLWIWISAIMISLGGFYNLLKKKNKKIIYEN